MIEQVIGILFPVFSLTLVGYIIGRKLQPDFTQINRINMDTCTPALVFSSLVVMPLDMSQFPLTSAAVIAILLPGILMIPVCKLLKLNFKAWAPPQMFRNSGNLAIPLFTYTFGETAIAPAIMLFVVSSCAHISVGLSVLSKGNPLRVMVRMPIFVAACLALSLNLSGIGVWQPLYDATSLLGQAAVPVMLLSLGSQMCNLRISGLRKGLLCTLLYLSTGATAFAAIYLFIPLPKLQLQMMVLYTLLPPAVMNYLFAERFNTEPENVASMVLFGNFFSLFTLPVILSFALYLG